MQVTPTRPVWYRDAPEPGAVNGRSDVAPPFRTMPACPVLSTTAQKDGPEQAIDEVREPACPGPGSDGLGGSPGVDAAGDGADQLVPSPRLRWPEPSTMVHDGPVVHEMDGSTGATTALPTGAG